MSNFSDTSWALREDMARPSGKPMGPGGSFNTDEPSYEDKDRDLGGSRYSTVMDQVFAPSQVQDILDAAFNMALTHLSEIVYEGVTQDIPLEVFAETSVLKADDLLETCVYRVLRYGLHDIPQYTFQGLTPVGVSNFLDWFMESNNGRSYKLASSLREAYITYLQTKHTYAK